jgi:hypothetical protein
LVALLVGAIPTALPSARFLTPLALNEKPAANDQKQVTVKAWLDYGFERRDLLEAAPSGRRPHIDDDPYDPTCTSIEVAARLVAVAKKLNHSYVLVSGVFFADLAGDRVFLGLCSKGGIRAMSIKPMP